MSTTPTNCPHCGAGPWEDICPHDGRDLTKPDFACGSSGISMGYNCAKAQIRQLTNERDELRTLNERLREALKRIVSSVPAMHEGQLYYEHYTPDGEYAGTQLVDPLSVVQEMDHIAHEALAKEVAND